MCGIFYPGELLSIYRGLQLSEYTFYWEFATTVIFLYCITCKDEKKPNFNTEIAETDKMLNSLYPHNIGMNMICWLGPESDWDNWTKWL